MDRYEILKEVDPPPPLACDLSGWDPNGWSMPVETASQLVKELNRQMYGFKDQHDRIIDKCFGIQGALHGD